MANADSTTTANAENLVFQPVTESTIAKLLKIPLGASHDLFQVLDACEAYVDELIENEDITERMALCGRLLAGLEVLRTVLKEPLPEHLIQRLTVEDDNFNDNSHALCSDSETIREYCQGMTIILLNQQNTAESQRQITGLLFELVHLLADDLKTPRFVRTADGLAMINGMDSSGLH